ncbi:hypothetical protein F5Y19DRAFT_479813 [Xylariaceae sp. FL1651]|nr:hypothetical protein F5Y19DRAFT_479813 [Xylariaceae sp. FL1651]
MSSTPSPETADPRLRDESSLGLQLGVASALYIFALTVSGLRIYSRAFLVKSFGVDDGFMIGAVLSALVSYILYIYQSQHGLGTHMVFVSDDDLFAFGAATFAQTIINLLSLGLLKISLSFSLLRLSRSKIFSRIVWSAIAIVSIYTIFAWLTLFLYCKPLSGFWDQSSHPKCYSIDLFIEFGVANTALSIITDITLASLPIPIIWQLQLKTRTRMYLIAILSLGWGAVAIGIVKAIKQLNFKHYSDSTYDISIVFWAFIQVNVSIIAACAPQLKKILRPLLGLTTASYGNPSYGNPSKNRRNTTGQSIGGRYMRQQSQFDKDEGFELDERPIVSPDTYHARVHTNDNGELGIHATATPSSDKMTHRSNSSDSIFGDVNPTGRNNRGIMRTTEVTISTT